MAKLTRADLKQFFETGDKPTQAQFADLIDSLFALIDNNTVDKVIIVNVPIFGTGAGGKILKRGNATLAMGEFSSDDTTITSDDGGFILGGWLFISSAVSSLGFDTSAIIQGLTNRTEILMNGIIGFQIQLVGGIFKVLITGEEINIGASILEKIGFYGKSPILKPAITGSRAGNAALTSLLTELDNLGIINNTTTI